jgi:hypothetical protein
MANTYILIASSTVSSNTAGITFSSIPQTYTDLVIKASTRVTASATAWTVSLSFNGSTSNFSSIRLYGSGSGAGASYSAGNYGVAAPGSTTTANTFNNGEIYISNYTSSNYKSYSNEDTSENNATEAYANLNAGLWSNTAAITSISLTAESPELLVTNSTFYLYGISNA